MKFSVTGQEKGYPLIQILDRISLQYAPNTNERKTNERFTRTIQKTHDTRNERTIHDANARYTKRTHDTGTNERNETNELYGKLKRTNARYTKRTNERIIGA